MADRTQISWCDSTFNGWIGCTKVSDGCLNCYAKADFEDRKHRVVWGAGQARSRTSVANWKKPLQWNAQSFYECPDCGLRGDAKAMGDEPKDCKHLNAAPARRRVFCSSLADVFDNEVDPAWRADLFDLIRSTPNLDWLLLTKRIGNWNKMVYEAIVHTDVAREDLRAWMKDWRAGDAPANVWIGATIVNQAEADRDIPKLLATPAAVRFLSMEPLLGPVQMTHLRVNGVVTVDALRGWAAGIGEPRPLNVDLLTGNVDHRSPATGPSVDWVICGGESGPKARPMHPQWARDLRDQCKAAGTPFMFKQVGEAVPVDTEVDCDHGPTVYALDGEVLLPGHRYRIHREGGIEFVRVPKKAAGRLLDGVEHNGFPA
jgi:protein gp37